MFNVINNQGVKTTHTMKCYFTSIPEGIILKVEVHHSSTASFLYYRPRKPFPLP